MKKLMITAACMATVLCSFANPITGKNKVLKTDASTLNATVAANGTRIIITAINELPNTVAVTLKDAAGNEVYEGTLVKGELAQSAIFNLEQLGEGSYSI